MLMKKDILGGCEDLSLEFHPRVEESGLHGNSVMDLLMISFMLVLKNQH